MAAITYSKQYDSFLTSTTDIIAGKIPTESVWDDNKLFHYLKKSGNYISSSGGNDYVENVQFGKNGTASGHAPSAGLNNTIGDEFTRVRFEQANYTVQTRVSGFEFRSNADPYALFNLIDERLKSAAMEMEDIIATDQYSTGDGTDYKFLGIQTAIADVPTTTSCGGVPTSELAWRNQYDSSAISFATDGEDKMQEMYMKCTVKGFGSPDLIITDRAGWTRYAKALRKDGRLLAPLEGKGNSGFDTLRFGKADVVWDVKCPANHWYYLNTKAMKYRYLSKADFILEGPLLDISQDAKFWRIIHNGQWTINSRRCLGVQSNVAD